MRGVPPFGLPKISTCASCIVRPTPLAKSLWSIWSNRVMLRLRMASFRRTTVSSTGNGLGLLSMPSTEGGVPDGAALFMVLSTFCS